LRQDHVIRRCWLKGATTVRWMRFVGDAYNLRLLLRAFITNATSFS
jgi:hypothetical protein